jgi:ubiquinone/menaquinone biosynthesis C-methylase UbiE
MESYRNFARFYDAAMGDRAKMAGRLRQLISQHKPDAETILELACGTGAMMGQLSEAYEVSGLDLSAEMLSVARKKLPRAEFFEGDMVAFDVGKSFDVIICSFDAINHVLNFSDWKRVFRGVERHLLSGGLFVFDMITERKLERLAREPAFAETFGDNLAVMEVTDAGRRIYNWNVRLFEHRGNNIYRLHEENIKEKSYPLGRVSEALLERFEQVKIVDFKRRRPTSKSERLYFVCRKS